MTTAAFFDFDRTVLDGDAGVLFGRELMRYQRHRVRDSGRGTLGWLGRNVAYETRIAALLAWGTSLAAGTKLGLIKRSNVIRAAYSKLKGLSLEELTELAQDYFEQTLADRLFPQARLEMERHHREGRRIVVVSTGMRILLEPVKRHLPVDDVLAVTLKDSDGVLTGKIEGPLWGHDKAHVVRDYAHARDLELPKSWGYSDHHSDLAFLRLVGHPMVVNPTWRLRRLARRKDWPILEWPQPEATKSDSAAAEAASEAKPLSRRPL